MQMAPSTLLNRYHWHHRRQNQEVEGRAVQCFLMGSRLLVKSYCNTQDLLTREVHGNTRTGMPRAVRSAQDRPTGCLSARMMKDADPLDAPRKFPLSRLRGAQGRANDRFLMMW